MEFTEAFKKKMEKLMMVGKFYDAELRSKVDEKMFELGEEAGDDALSMYDFTLDAEDDDEYWMAYHCLADWIL